VFRIGPIVRDEHGFVDDEQVTRDMAVVAIDPCAGVDVLPSAGWIVRPLAEVADEPTDEDVFRG
jgi:hypothetical protein